MRQLLEFSSSSDWFVLLFQQIVIGPKSLNMNNLQENHKKRFLLASSREARME